MKEIFLFLKWQYSKLEFWQIVFLVNAFVMGFTAFRTDEISKFIFQLAIIVPLLYMIKWFVIERVIDSWKAYKKEKAELFQVIKGEQ